MAESKEIALNVSKTEIAIFLSQKESRSRKRWTFNWVDKRLNQKGTKYFRIHLDEHSNLKDHVNALERKLLVQSY